MYAKVLIFLPIKAKSSPYFDYRVPAALAQTVRPGVLVVAPLRTRKLPGIVMALADSSDLAPDEIRPIESVLDPEPVLDETRRTLAQWIARETLAPLHKCVQTMLPPGMRPKAYLRLTPLVTQLPPDLPDSAAALLRLLLRRGPLRSSQIARALTEIDWHAARRTLQRRDLIKVERRLRLPHVRPKTVRKARLIAPPAQWEQKMSGLRRTQLYRAILSFLEEEGGPVELDVICAETGAQSYHLKMLDQRELISFSREEIVRDPLADLITTPDAPPLLLPDQQAAWEELAGHLTKQRHRKARRAPAPVLLLGVTGSGKTELYLRATAQVLDRGQQALILVPEISLTPQTVRRFMVRFPGRVGLWHSQMSRGERYDTWQRVRSGEIDVIVGARSALFTPFSDLGLIVIDEEEDASYKQSRQPYYHARETATALARLTGALLIMGSATPSLEAYARAQAGRYRLITLERRIVSHSRRVADWQRVLHLRQSRYRPVASAPHACTIALPPVQIVDMRAELQAGNRSIFSGALQSAVTQALAREEQVLLFLNRRGAATYVFCRDCGWVAECPDCDLPLTAHRRVETLICHHCGHREAMAHTCPKCGSHRVRAFGLGTEGLAEQTAKRWPEAR
ncbi:MAG: DEAD/DEAH box helicase, partial [Chloroflexi bacterium]|nr:DEAD/DEAH box helicase [Chloroflexota bacterium]